MGHSGCGALQASLNFMKNPSQKPTKHIESIVNQIKPAIQSLTATNDIDSIDAAEAVKANVKNAVTQLRNL